MNKTILFSPVGGTDPMSETNCCDGALLHISRHFKPDQIYLFMSSEIMENHHKDNRYIGALELLENKIGHTFDIHRIEYPDYHSVHDFEMAFQYLSKEVQNLAENIDETDTLYLNVSSGTPAMKSALLVISVMLDIPCKCIQVATPSRKMQVHEHSKGLYPLNEIWELNPDNEDGDETKPENRTKIADLPSLMKWRYESVIKGYIHEFDYAAALTLARQLRKEGDPVSYLEKLELAYHRVNLNFDEVDARLRKTGSNPRIYRPFKDGTSRTILEYILKMRIHLKRKDYASFIREYTPLLGDLFKSIIKEELGIPIQDFMRRGYEDRITWDLDALNNNPEILNAIETGYKHSFKPAEFIKNRDLGNLIIGLTEREDLKNCIRDLMRVESKARNTAAHQMVSVTDEWILKRMGFSANAIMKKIEIAVDYSEFQISPENWLSYEEMNDDIIQSMA